MIFRPRWWMLRTGTKAKLFDFLWAFRSLHVHDILFNRDLYPTPLGEPPERPTCTRAEKDSQPKPQNKGCEEITGRGRTEGLKDEDEWQREEEHGHISCCRVVFIFLFAGRSFKFPTFRQYYWNTNLAPTQVT